MLLPVDSVLPDLIDALRGSNCLVLKAPAGAGKTTRVPPALLDAGFAAAGQIIMLEPRRLAARTAAARMAFERGQAVGQQFGFRVRFEEAVSRDTKVLAVTEGVLLRRLQDDPFLDDIAVVVFDEFHERRLDSDLALAMVRRVQQTVRPDLRIIVMSATLDPEPIARWLGDCPVICSEGRLFPVKISWFSPPQRLPIPDLAAAGIERVLQSANGGSTAATDGDILVFLPGVGEIHRTAGLLERLAASRSLAVLPLFGEMTSEEQDRVLGPCDRRRVILATNVAETSITIDGVTAVVDTGYARQMLFDADSGLDRLELVPVSQASADQRAGRAGRTAPGICLRLWDESSHRRRPAWDAAELQRVDLSSAVLRLMAWGEADPQAFPWFEAPPQSSLEHAVRLLELLGAVSAGTATETGQRMVRFPTAPRLARMLIEAADAGVAERACLLAAMLSERDPFLRPRPGSGNPGGREAANRTTVIRQSRSDVLDRLHALEDWFAEGRGETVFGEVNRAASRTIAAAAKQLSRVLKEARGGMPARPTVAPADTAGDEALLQALVAGFPDRVAKRRDSGGDKALMVGGRGVRLGARSAVRQAPLFLCVDIDGAGSDAEVRQASEVLRSWLPASGLRDSNELFFHPSQKQVVARRRLCFADLVLEETPAAIQDSIAAAECLFAAAVGQWAQVLPPDDDPFHSFLQRMRCLRVWMPELSLPDCGDELLRSLLQELCYGRRSFSELKAAPWLSALQGRLEYSLVQTIEREAPEKLLVPSGSRIRLEYAEGRPPVLAVRIQEIFGLTATPRIAGGRISVLLHLLAPNYRPQQITDDLASFWANTYDDVKKDLKRRYPKHSWPDDPLTAVAVKKG